MTTVTAVTSTVDPTLVATKKLVKPSPFCADSSSAGGTDPTTGVFSDLNHDQLFTEFNVRAAHQMSLSVEVRMRAEYSVKENRRLKFVAGRQGELLKVRE
uniref:Uncharacterized protein n=1 Tax=Tanacetum cinerariifolium TaxID=118510 RepID=A0A699TX85_TANCI|nr:hypothetical protein [Tanacetum cinerariifolium]